MSANEQRISGVFTALITPFTDKGELDFAALDRILEHQLSSGVAGLVVNGTTAESPTLSDAERQSLVQHVVKSAHGKVLVFVGTGSNCTKKTIQQSREAAELGADGLLVVNPYYSKPSQEGLYQHFRAVAEATPLPVMLYNIKGRCAVNLETETLARLFELQTIKAVKEASGDIAQMSAVLARRDSERADFAVLSGDDALTFPLMALGGEGVVSVASNIAPRQLVELYTLCKSNAFAEARPLHFSLLPLFEGLFCETNPAPVKYAAHLLFGSLESVRLPLVPLSEEKRSFIRELVEKVR